MRTGRQIKSGDDGGSGRRRKSKQTLWRINDARQFIRNNGAEQRNLEIRLAAVAQAAFNEEVTKHTVRGVLSDERAQIMLNVKTRLVSESKPFGIEIIEEVPIEAL